MLQNIIFLVLMCSAVTSTLSLDCGGYAEGDSWEPQSCEFCSCVSGSKICASPSCFIPCDNPVPGEGACCPTCPDETPTTPPDCDGFREGDSWEPQPCELCSCVSGSKICASPDCYVPCANPIPEEGACCPTCPDGTSTPPPDCDGYAEGDFWEPQPCEFCSCVSGRKICASPSCFIPCDNPIPGEGACCPTCPDETPTPPPDCDGYAEGDSWEPQPCEFCSCVSGRKICASPSCFVPCENPIPGEGVCCPTCPDESHCKNVKKCGPYSFWNKDKCECECRPVKCLPGYTFNTKKCRCQCKKKTCPHGFYFDRKFCDCKCRSYLECEPGQYFSLEICGCRTKNGSAT